MWSGPALRTSLWSGAREEAVQAYCFLRFGSYLFPSSEGGSVTVSPGVRLTHSLSTNASLFICFCLFAF